MVALLSPFHRQDSGANPRLSDWGGLDHMLRESKGYVTPFLHPQHQHLVGAQGTWLG